MLVVGNIGREEQSAALDLDLKKLKIDGKKISCYNLWTGEVIESLDNLKVAPNNFLLIGIRIQE
jgi:hypothetical protein